MQHDGNSEIFMKCFDERAMPKVRDNASTKENAVHRVEKIMKNQCSKLLLAVTRMSYFDQYLLLHSKRLNAIPEFDKYCKYTIIFS